MAGFYIHTLGKLEIYYDGKEIVQDTSGSGKVLQLLLILVWAGEQGVSRGRLQDYLYDRRNVDSANALRVTVTRLRKYIEKIGLAEQESIVSKKGNYYLGSKSTAPCMDAVQMEQLYDRACRESDKEKKAELLVNACRLYEGEFLPSMSGDSWVEFLRGYYQEIYIKCTRDACAAMNETEKYEGIQELCDRALEHCPMEEWVELKIRSLVCLKRYRDAEKAYNDAAVLFFGQDGQWPSEEKLENFRKLGAMIQEVKKNGDDVRDSLVEKKREIGAYCCSFPGFIDCYRMYLRVSERSMIKGYLLICSVVGRNGRELREADIGYFSDLFCDVVHRQLRRGDIYTVYSPGRILILLSNLNERDVEIVKRRISSSFWKCSGQRAVVKIESADLVGWEERWQEELEN